MAVLASSLQKKISEAPTQPQNVIVRVSGDMETAQQRLQNAGFQVRRRLNLINGFAGSAPGINLNAVAREPWVQSIEEDQQVHTL